MLLCALLPRLDTDGMALAPALTPEMRLDPIDLDLLRPDAGRESGALPKPVIGAPATPPILGAAPPPHDARQLMPVASATDCAGVLLETKGKRLMLLLTRFAIPETKKATQPERLKT